MNHINILRQFLENHEPVDRWENHTFPNEAAVLIAVTESENPHIILTKRSENLSTHKGQVAFPGGKKDEEDESLIITALRESHEEVDLHPDKVEVLGYFDSMVTRFGMKITPVVGLVSEDVELTANPDELDAIFKVPLAFLLQDDRLRTDSGTIGGHRVDIPCWEYEGYEIWGVTAVILSMLMVQVFGLDIDTGLSRVDMRDEKVFEGADWKPLR